MLTLTEEANLFIHDIAMNDPYRLFGPNETLTCRFCLRPKRTRDHAPGCEYERAIQILQLSEAADSDLYD